MIEGKKIQQIERSILEILYNQMKFTSGAHNSISMESLRRELEADLGNVSDFELEAAVQNLSVQEWITLTGRLTDQWRIVGISQSGLQEAMRLFGGYVPPAKPIGWFEWLKFAATAAGIAITALTLIFTVTQCAPTPGIPAPTPIPTLGTGPVWVIPTSTPNSCSVENTVRADRNLAVGVTIRVETGRGVSVREGPGADLYTEKFVWTNLVNPGYPPDSPVVIKRYQTAQIIDGPRCIPSQRLGETTITWWHLQFTDGERGWAAGNNRDGPILRAVVP